MNEKKYSESFLSNFSQTILTRQVCHSNLYIATKKPSENTNVIMLESFVNELLCDLFDFLTIGELFRAFSGLNSRFDSLLLRYIRTRDVNFRSISKQDFDTICLHYVPLTFDKIKSLCFSNENDTPEQINRFYEHGFILQQFTHLQSLTLCRVRVGQMVNEIQLGLSQLLDLTHLILDGCNLGYDQSSALSLINTIWNLPKLTHCYFNDSLIFIHDQGLFVPPTITSSSIQHLSILNIDDHEFKIADLFQRTPNLRHFSISIWAYCSNFTLSSSVLSITALKLIGCSYSAMVDLLKRVPNLCQLRVCIDHYINGQGWEQVISNYVPKLKILQFNMGYRLDSNTNYEEQIDEILNSFRSPFWLNTHRWFVQCECSLNNINNSIYTLPFTAKQFSIYNHIFLKSTYPQGNYQSSYECVRILDYTSHLSQESNSSQIQFSSIEEISIELPMMNHIWSSLLKFNQLTSMKVSSYHPTEDCIIQIQALLDCASRLSSLEIQWKSVTSLESVLFKIKSSSINHLKLLSYEQWFDTEQCLKLSRSPIGIQCEVLSIGIQSRTCILDLVNNMNKLRALTIECQDDQWNQWSKSTEDGFLNWLREHLPAKCQVTNASRWESTVRLWIG